MKRCYGVVLHNIQQLDRLWVTKGQKLPFKLYQVSWIAPFLAVYFTFTPPTTSNTLTSRHLQCDDYLFKRTHYSFSQLAEIWRTNSYRVKWETNIFSKVQSVVPLPRISNPPFTIFIPQSFIVSQNTWASGDDLYFCDIPG